LKFQCFIISFHFTAFLLNLIINSIVKQKFKLGFEFYYQLQRVKTNIKIKQRNMIDRKQKEKVIKDLKLDLLKDGIKKRLLPAITEILEEVNNLKVNKEKKTEIDDRGEADNSGRKERRENKTIKIINKLIYLGFFLLFKSNRRFF